jgi:hypothetical protein
VFWTAFAHNAFALFTKFSTENTAYSYPKTTCPQFYTQMLWKTFIHEMILVFHRFFQREMVLSTVLYTNALENVYPRNDFGFPQVFPV